MKNIVLTGFMGAGKSTVGRILSKKTGMPLIDTDEKIEENSRMKISEIFENFGESYFRYLEEIAIKELSFLKNHIIITGGGVVLNKKNIKRLKKHGIIIHLNADAEAIYHRIKHEGHRPLLQVKEPLKKIKELLKEREPYYAENHYSIDTTALAPEEAADKILELLR